MAAIKTNKVIYRFISVAVLCLVFFPGGCAPLQSNKAKPFTLIALPDTQCYADTRLRWTQKEFNCPDQRHCFYRQTEWVREKRQKLNILMVAHLGDIVQTDYDQEWQIADRAFKSLDRSVPYILCVGNHDMGYRPHPEGTGKCAETRETKFNRYFPASRFAGKGWYGGHLGEGNENSYCLFEGGGVKFIIISLEFKPRDETLAWANEVVSQYSDRRCIVVTHGYLNAENTRQSSENYPVKGNAGEAIWRKFVRRHENIFLVLCGHVLGEGLLTSTGENGNRVHQVLADYQGRKNGGEGYLRIMTFIPAEERIEVRTYSPVLDKYLKLPTSQFTLDYRIKGRDKARSASK